MWILFVDLWNEPLGILLVDHGFFTLWLFSLIEKLDSTRKHDVGLRLSTPWQFIVYLRLCAFRVLVVAQKLRPFRVFRFTLQCLVPW